MQGTKTVFDEEGRSGARGIVEYTDGRYQSETQRRKKEESSRKIDGGTFTRRPPHRHRCRCHWPCSNVDVS